jgi:transketolase
MRDSFVSAVTEKLRAERDVVLLTGDLGFGIFDEISECFPDRFINVGVAEQNMVGLGSGMAMMGKKAFCYSIANFSFMRGLEQFRNGAVYHGANVTLVCSGGGFTYGQLGFTHFAIEDYGILSTFGSIEVLHPATSEQVRRCVADCVEYPGPKYLRLEKAELAIPALASFGERRGLEQHRTGERLAIVAVGGLLETAMQAAAAASDEVAVYSLVRHRALTERAVVDELRKYDLILSLEEHVFTNGVGQKLSALGLNVRALAIHDTGPAIVGDQAYLRDHYGLTPEGVVRALAG